MLDFTPHVVNKNGNVVFRSENPDGVRGHLLLHGRSDIDIRSAEFQSLGRTDINDLGPTNQKGRYPVHAHHLIGPRDVPENGYQFTLIGNTVDFGEENRQADQDRKWGISIHGSHYGLIERNVVDYASGAGIVTESGEEMGNRFSKNFVVRVINGNGEREEDRDPSDGSKLGRVVQVRPTGSMEVAAITLTATSQLRFMNVSFAMDLSLTTSEIVSLFSRVSKALIPLWRAGISLVLQPLEYLILIVMKPTPCQMD